MMSCTLCPRECGADRTAGAKGVCGCGSTLKAARAALHYWEEPCLTGGRGSGAVFFSGCPLHCVYCQNRMISDGKAGFQITTERLSDILLELQDKGAVNINLVTASHFLLPVAEALRSAKRQGLHLPIVYNSSGYEKTDSLKRLEGLIDIYLPDFKYMDPETARKYSRAPDYPSIAKTAIAEMVRQVPTCSFEDNQGTKKDPEESALMKKGVIVRHLVLPGHVKEAEHILGYLYETYGDRIYLSVMNQYTPMPAVQNDPLLGRKVTRREYERVLDYALSLGIKNAFFQEGGTAEESFIPAFDGEGVIPGRNYSSESF